MRTLYPLPPLQGASALLGADRSAGVEQCSTKPLHHPSPCKGEEMKSSKRYSLREEIDQKYLFQQS